MRLKKQIGFIITLALLIVGYGIYHFSANEQVDYSTQIKPILNRECLACHGGVKKSGGFSLLFEKEAMDTTESGKYAIIPGNAEESEMIRRLVHHDPEERMPLESEPLPKEEIDLLKRWINQGAKWGEHWAYVKPEKVTPPTVETAQASTGDAITEVWKKNVIDKFILTKLQDEGFKPSPQADCATLIRRVSLDLTGLPPTPEEVEAFCSNYSLETYEKLVDRLLDSPAYGERWASMWMDMARYADTKGYERDPHREIWKYRDWLIKAFNEDKPFDEFTIEQLAGDLLPNPTPDQYIATAFHRNTMNNDEGGTDNEEFRVAAVIDRVNTTWEVWQGTTFSCVQCHSHPYDPFTHEDYYESYAFFNNTRDEDTYTDAPNYKIYEQEEDEQKIKEVKNWITAKAEGNEVEKTRTMKDFEQLIHITEPKIFAHNFDSLTKGTHADTKFLKMYDKGYCYLDNFVIGNKTQLLINYSWAKPGQIQIRKGGTEGEVVKEIRLSGKEKGIIAYDLPVVNAPHDLYFTFRNDKGERDVCQLSWLLFHEPLPGEGQKGYASVQNTFLEILNANPQQTPILAENPEDYHRESYMFVRGNWLVHGKEVQPGVPATLHNFPEDAPRNRLGFAQWLVSKENPLTARVMVNRFWEQLFGIGIVETVEDFGSQGAPPSHPQLLDWLAVQFMQEYDWSMKQLLKTMVMSATYRQSSEASAELLALDPANRMLARGPRVRLSAEQVRDQALVVGNLLSDKMYGESVMPPQPPGVWQVVYNGGKWVQSEGEDRYRRAVYTYWRRTSPYPSMVSFDAPSREFCSTRRIRTNTPLQALVTLNDPVYVEAAQGLGAQMKRTTGDVEEQIKFGYKRAMFQEIADNKLNELLSLYNDVDQYFEENPEEIDKMLADPAAAFNIPEEDETDEGEGMEEEIDMEVPETEEAEQRWPCEGKDCQELASFTVVANAIMNLDEFITKE